MKKLSTLILAVSIFFSFSYTANGQPTPGSSEISIKTVVDPGLELITIMMWLSGKYPMPMDSQYKSDVWRHFSKYKQHPALDRMKKAEMYPNFTEMGLLFSGFPDIKLEVPEKNSWYEKKDGKEHIVGILNDARVFARVTNFWTFYQKHSADYARMSGDFAAELNKKEVLPAIDSFFRNAPGGERPEVTIYLEPLNNWGAHAIDFMRLRNEPNGDRVTFQIGPAEQDLQLPDAPVIFQANSLTIQNVWHEASHVYLRKALAENKTRIAALERLFNASALASQNIKTWDYAIEENLVRAIVAVVTKQKFGEDAYKREIAGQTQRGFIYTADIAKLIVEKTSAGNSTAFTDLMPEILTMLETKPDAKK